MNEAAVFDIDGTISDDRWRRPLIDWAEPDPDKRYEAYHSACSADKLINKHLIDPRVHRGDQIVFVTARPDRYHEQTKSWLCQHLPDLAFVLLTRAEGNHDPSPQLKLSMLRSVREKFSVAVVYDDREDVFDALAEDGFNAVLVKSMEERNSPATRLRAMAGLYEERTGQYGEVWRIVPQLVAVLFPRGVPPWLLTDPRWHLFELKLVKLARFANTELTHLDSIHDDGVFSAMIAHILKEAEEKQ